MQIEAIKFRREQGGEDEFGIIVNNDSAIVDEKGQYVQAPIWNYWRLGGLLSVTIHFSQPVSDPK